MQVFIPNLSNSRFPPIEGLYNTEVSSLHLNELLYNASSISQYILIFILLLIFGFYSTKYIASLRSKSLEILSC